MGRMCPCWNKICFMLFNIEMNFNTQICTTREQSSRLLALGVKKETADMHYDLTVSFSKPQAGGVEVSRYGCQKGYIEPAWSLHRLVAMCPDFVIAEQRNHEKLYEQVIANIKFAIEEGSFDVKYLEE